MSTNTNTTKVKDGKKKKTASKKSFSGLRNKKDLVIENLIRDSEFFYHVFETTMGFKLTKQYPDEETSKEALIKELYLLRQYSFLILKVSKGLDEISQEMNRKGSKGGRPKTLAAEIMILALQDMLENISGEKAHVNDITELYNLMWKADPTNKLFEVKDDKKTPTGLLKSVSPRKVSAVLKKYKD